MMIPNTVASEPKRDKILHCHVSTETKLWLLRTSDKTNKPIGRIVDELLTKARAKK